MTPAHGTLAVLGDVVTSEDRRARYLADGLWDDATFVGGFAAHARSKPDAVAVVDEVGTMTFAELDHASDRLAGHLAARGIRPGEVVSVQLPNWREAAVVALGIAKSGAVIHTMLPVYRANELRHMLGRLGSRMVITPGSYRGFDHRGLIREIAGELPALRDHLVVREPGPDSMREALARAEPLSAPRPRAAGEVSLVVFTSGTEAAPKAIMHCDRTFGFSARAAFTALGMSETDVVWMPSPIGHSTGFNYGLRFALHHGLKLVLQDRWDGAAAATLIEQHRCSYTLAATTFLRDLLVNAAGRDLSSMRLFGCGGAPVPADLVLGARDAGVQVLRLYGSTEVLVATWNRPTSPLEKRTSTDGAPVHAAIEVTVRDAEGRPCEPGVTGEAWVRGPNTCVGFHADPERTRSTFDEEGWVRSGDLVQIDEDGYLTVVGRKKEIIIRGGLNIAPRETEDVLVRMPQVRAVAVVGLPDERLGEISCACVVLEEGSSLSLDDIVAHLERAGVAKYKFPQRLELLEELPTTASGKVQKHRLREWMTSGRDAAATNEDTEE